MKKILIIRDIKAGCIGETCELSISKTLAKALFLGYIQSQPASPILPYLDCNHGFNLIFYFLDVNHKHLWRMLQAVNNLAVGTNRV